MYIFRGYFKEKKRFIKEISYYIIARDDEEFYKKMSEDLGYDSTSDVCQITRIEEILEWKIINLVKSVIVKIVKKELTGMILGFVLFYKNKFVMYVVIMIQKI